MFNRKGALPLLLFVGSFLIASSGFAANKPNILVIMGDDIGYWNLSYNNKGMMGYQTPNIDRPSCKRRYSIYRLLCRTIMYCR